MDQNPFKYTFDMINLVLPPDHKVLFAFEQTLLIEYQNLLEEARQTRHSLTVREAGTLAKKIKLMSKIALHCVSHYTDDLKKLLSRANGEAATLRMAVKRFVQPIIRPSGDLPK